MKLHVVLFLGVLFAAGAVNATNVSTADPSYPSSFEDIDSSPLREQFHKLINDIDNLWAAIGPNFLEANQILGALVSGKAQALPVPSCFSPTNALTWRPGLGFGCNDIEGAGGSLNPAPAYTVLAGPAGGSPAVPTAIQLTANYLPLPSANSIGGVESVAPVAHQFMTGISTSGVPLLGTPGFSDITGIVGAAQLPTPSASSLGGTESIAVVPHNFMTGISTAGVPTQAQPNFNDVSGNISVNQMASGSGASSSTFWRGDGVWASSPSASLTGNAYGLNGYGVVYSNTHHAFGDSITAGADASNLVGDSTQGYAYLLALAEGAAITNRGIDGEQACDMADQEVFPNENPGDANNPIYTMMIGTNDAWFKGAGSYEAVYNDCVKASLTWLAISSSYKTFAQNCTATGTWSASSAYPSGVGSVSTTNGSRLTCNITTFGGPLYLWYRHHDSDGGAFTYSVDGGSSISVATATSPAINTHHSYTFGDGLIRVPGLAAGSHTVVVNVTSATSASNSVAIGGVGTPAPATNPFYEAPTIFMSGVLKEQNDQVSSDTAAYNADALADVAFANADGLRVFKVDVRNYLVNADMFDQFHPGSAGHVKLKNAFAAAEQFIPSAIINATPADNATCTPGQQWWDTGFIYLCTASGTVKRAALSTY